MFGNTLAARGGSYDKMSQMYDNSVQSSSDSQAPISRPIVEYTSGDLRDPFQGVNTKPDASRNQAQTRTSVLPKLVVQGIMWGGKFNQAIINNKVVKAGDIIEGAQIISIDKSKIILLFEDRKYNLSVAGESKPQEKAKQSVTLEED